MALTIIQFDVIFLPRILNIQKLSMQLVTTNLA